MKKLGLAMSVIALSLIGCGSTEDSNENEVIVERGPVLKASVIDAKGQIATEVGNGKYRFKNTPSYPITAMGGFIDINRDGDVSVGDVNNTLIYHSSDGKAVTIVNAISKNKEIRDYLKYTYQLKDWEIDNDLPKNNNLIAAISDVVYAYCIDKNISEPQNLSLTDIEVLKTQIQTQLDKYKIDKNISEVEDELVTNLGVKKLDDNDIEVLNTIGYHNNTDIQRLPKYTLTLENKKQLAHMWDEEKLAHDLYIELYNKFSNLETLNIIGSKSEARHQSKVEELISKYDLNITSSDFNGTYDADTLASYKVGEFISSKIQNLYNDLYQKGISSDIDALKVGCMVEVTDVIDLNEYIDSNIMPDMLLVFEHLRDGSYHHYWAFDRALKSLGVEDGCCSLGTEYCKKEYPKDK